MLHVVTVHYLSDAWIEPQLRYLRRFTPPDTQVWASLDGIEHGRGFEHETTLDGSHADKLNELARRVSEVARPDDHVLFLDGDAFPVAPLGPLLAAPDRLVAVRRDENLGDPQPHPCFCLTTVGLWNDIGGDWSLGAQLDELPRSGDHRRRGRAAPPTRRAGHPLAGAHAPQHHGPATALLRGLRRRRRGSRRLPPRRRVPGAQGRSGAHQGPAGDHPRGSTDLGRAERSIRWRAARRRKQSPSYQRKAAGQDALVRGWIAEDDNIVGRFCSDDR